MQKSVSLALLTIAWLCLACTTIIDLSVNDKETLAGNRTWSWMSRPANTSGVQFDTEVGRSRALGMKLTELIEYNLTKLGFEQVAEDADFYVTYSLIVQRQIESILVPRAPYTLTSHSSAPSYVIEGSTQEDRNQVEIRLRITALEPQHAILWNAELTRVDLYGSMRLLGKDVASLMERFPRRRDSNR